MPPAGPFETKADFLYATHIKIGRDEHKKLFSVRCGRAAAFSPCPGNCAVPGTSKKRSREAFANALLHGRCNCLFYLVYFRVPPLARVTP